MESRSLSNALEGVRVLDFSQIVVGPYCTLQLGYFGAEIIKVESKGRPDGWRLRDGGRDLEQSGAFADLNRNKLSITLNLKSPRGVEIAKDLARVSDVVIENFSVDVMSKLGLDYPNLRAVNERIIMVSLQGLGHTGPQAHYVTWGPNLLSFSGMNYLWSLEEDIEPVGTQTSYPDYAVGVYAAGLIMGALFYRRVTGKGQYLDVSQAEVTACLLGPSYLECLNSGVVRRPRGNASDRAAPHGCYRCAGEDSWCVIAVENEGEWQGLLAALPDVPALREPRFETLLERLQHSGDLDRILGEWTRMRTAEEVSALLQRHGVPASVVSSGRTLVEDDHLRARGYLDMITHPRMGEFLAPGIPVRLTETPARVRRHAPLLGQDNRYVFGTLLGLTEDRIRELEAEGVIA